MEGTQQGDKRRYYSQSKVASMMAKARATLEGRQQAHIDAQHQRLHDPLERAKLSLQRADLRVFSHSLLVPGSTLIVVGSRTMTAVEVIAHAERYGR